MTSIARDLATWAAALGPTADDLDLADRSLLDTVAVAVAARNEPLVQTASFLSEAARWAVAAHVLDFDDLHMESTTHISAVCVPAVLAAGGDARAYLAAAGVMSRLGTALGWSHYTSGWHATTTAGAPAAAVGAGVALGLDADRLATAMALAVPAAGGVQRAFGTDCKPLQVGFAADAGVRAAYLAAAGASADVSALDQWLELVGGDPSAVDLTGPAIPGGLAIKVFPCCYALQRPISALADLATQVDAAQVSRIMLKTPKGTVTPLIHHRPDTGLQAKFSLEYAAATALLDSYQGFASFTDQAVRRPEARRLMDLVDVQLGDGGDRLLAGEFEAEVHTGDDVLRVRSRFPPGSPQRPPTRDELLRKVEDCLDGTTLGPETIGWSSAGQILRDHL
ncbi:2-methylcitrate dehydratase PrpD [Streptosporangium subroseum]|uniref:2-methylcitrate dehydratase PrpD n=1 Tax=Streptosporangium subroseum TaxID=106412 RepID=A0A239NBI0_9ACTN|nr:MmgE/PrpD family protein [Streptosporangium subroseum]SNT51598.1 2-methylcitrate dehydratase PrpD [Streptosporangium subroseum]